MHSFALYKSISDMRFMAILKGMTVCSHEDNPRELWPPEVHWEQKTVSQVSQNSNS